MNKYKNLSPVSVRVDFVENGEIIPLGIMAENGKTCIIDRIENRIRIILGCT